MRILGRRAWYEAANTPARHERRDSEPILRFPVRAGRGHVLVVALSGEDGPDVVKRVGEQDGRVMEPRCRSGSSSTCQGCRSSIRAGSTSSSPPCESWRATGAGPRSPGSACRTSAACSRSFNSTTSSRSSLRSSRPCSGPQRGPAPKTRMSLLNRTSRKIALTARRHVRRGVSRLGGRLSVGAAVVVVTLTALAAVLAWRQYDDSRERALKDVQSRAILAEWFFQHVFQRGAVRDARGGSRLALGHGRRHPRHEGLFHPCAAQGRDALPWRGSAIWVDLDGVVKASSSSTSTQNLNLSDRSYVRAVIATGKPFSSVKR